MNIHQIAKACYPFRILNYLVAVALITYVIYALVFGQDTVSDASLMLSATGALWLLFFNLFIQLFSQFSAPKLAKQSWFARLKYRFTKFSYSLITGMFVVLTLLLLIQSYRLVNLALS